MSHVRSVLLCLAALAVLGVLSCSDDEVNCPPCGEAPLVPALENIWPHADSTSWTFALTESSWQGSAPILYPSRDQVPPPPTADDLFALIDSTVPGDSVETTRAIYRLQFLGQITTQSGAQGQNLTEAKYSPVGPTLPPPPRDASTGFLLRLWKVRPDLRAAMAARGLGPERTNRLLTAQLADPLYLHGHVWTQTPDLIGNYGDLDTLVSWIYLRRDLSPGSGFTHQLVPGLASDVLLRAGVRARRSLRTEIGTFQNCVVAVYGIDYGITAVVDEQGNELGYSRYWDAGMIIYAPGIGPIYSYEVHPSMPGDLALSGQDEGPYTLRLDLIGTSAVSTPRSD